MNLKQQIVIFGTTEAAIMSHYYFTQDSDYGVAAFTVDRKYLQADRLNNLPLVPFEEVEYHYPPQKYKMFVAIYFGKLNRTREEKYFQSKEKGYELVSYVSSKALTWPDLAIGDNCIIGDGGVVNPYAKIGNNVVIAGGFVGHHSVIEDHCFLSANAVVLGCSTIGAYSFIGANSTIGHGLRIGKKCIIGAGVTMTKNAKDKCAFLANPPLLLPRSSDQLSTWLNWSIR